MADLLENPLGLQGVEFVEFASLTPGVIERSFDALGFVRIAQHRSKQAALYRQGGINFIVNNEPDRDGASLMSGDAPFVSGLALRVGNANEAFSSALELGAASMDADAMPVGLRVPPLQGIGGFPLYLVDSRADGDSLYEEFEFLPGVDRHPAGCGLTAIDHLAHAVYGGRLSYWARLYERLFGSCALRCHDIQGANSSAARPGPEGIRHIALSSDDLAATIHRLRTDGVPLIDAPSGNVDASASCLLLRPGSDTGCASFTLQIPPGRHCESLREDDGSPSAQRPRTCTLA